MTGHNPKSKFSLMLATVVLLSVVPSFGASAVIGSVAGSTNATVGGQALTPNTTLFSGDSLRVTDGAAIVAVGMGSRMVFGQNTVAKFERSADEVTVNLGQGFVSLYHPEGGVAMRVKVGDVAIVAGKGFKTLGEVAMVNGAVVITAKEGSLHVEGQGRSMDLAKGKSIAILQKPAGAPQAAGAGAGAAASHASTAEVVGWVGLGGSAASTTLGVVNIKRTNDVKTLTTKTDQDALAAGSSAAAANSAASTAASNSAVAASNAAIAASAAVTACHVISPTASKASCGG